MCSGFVQWEYKRGKWQKRWLELREHSLWLSKRDTVRDLLRLRFFLSSYMSRSRVAKGKDEQMLCSLNNFDAYVVTRVSKAPKPFVFAVKSTDNLAYFESASDYVHVFSCGEPEGQNWLEKILLARVSFFALIEVASLAESTLLIGSRTSCTKITSSCRATSSPPPPPSPLPSPR